MSTPDALSTLNIEVSQALIHFQGRYLMQLRDFKDGIESPGHWGFFAGHIESGESAEQTIWREIKEELSWQPKKFDFLGNLKLRNRRMHVFYCDLNNEIESLSLQEGEEIGVFLPEEIHDKQLYSKKRIHISRSQKYLTGSLKNSPKTLCDEKCKHVEPCH